MKRRMVVVVLLMGLTLITGGVANAAAIIVDMDTAFSVLNGFSLGYTATTDKDSNGMADLTEYSLMTAILAETAPATPSAIATVQAAWNANFSALATAGTAVAGAFGATAGNAVQTVLAAALTCGDASKVTYVQAALTALGIGATMPASPDLTAAAILGKNGDADGDALDNFTEYTTAGGVRATYVTDALTAAGPPALAVSISGAGTKTVGSLVTLTANASGGTTPYTTYVWKRGVTTVGTNSSTLTFASIGYADAGSYTVTVTDSAPNSVTSGAVALTVVDPSLPVMGYAGIALLLALCTIAGVISVRRVSRHH